MHVGPSTHVEVRIQLMNDFFFTLLATIIELRSSQPWQQVSLPDGPCCHP